MSDNAMTLSVKCLEEMKKQVNILAKDETKQVSGLDSPQASAVCSHNEQKHTHWHTHTHPPTDAVLTQARQTNYVQYIPVPLCRIISDWLKQDIASPGLSPLYYEHDSGSTFGPLASS